MEERMIKPVHLYDDYGTFYESIVAVGGDMFPYQVVWQYFRDAGFSFEEFCEFLNTHQIENWIFDDGSGKMSIRLRLSQIHSAAIATGLAKKLGMRETV